MTAGGRRSLALSIAHLADAKRARDYIAKGVRWAGISAVKDGSMVFGVGEGAGPEGTDCE